MSTTASPCPDIRHLKAFALGNLTPADARAVGDHLRHCAGCRAQLGGVPGGAPDTNPGLLAPSALPSPSRRSSEEPISPSARLRSGPSPSHAPGAVPVPLNF